MNSLMKNLNLIPTDKPSRLSILNSGKLNFGAEAMSSSNSKLQHIYITSDEEIKEGDWFLTDDKRVEKCAPDWRAREWHKKIILTTDQELIADGVQAIDDEFLEWFVKNPSCEEIEIEDWYSIYLSCCQSKEQCSCNKKRIIIPKQVTKQGTMSEAIKQVISNQLKQERLEEAFEFWSDRQSSYDELDILRFGAKWQQERSYSEEEVRKISLDFFYHWWNAKGSNTEQGFDEWFEQFKKK